MRRSTLNLWFAATVIALGVVTAPAVKATSEDERPGEIGILAGVGFADQDLVGEDFKSEVNPLIGGALRVAFHRRRGGLLRDDLRPLRRRPEPLR